MKGTKMTKIEFLQGLAKGWFGNSQQHSIQAQLLKQRGFGKLADKIMAESEEEWNEAKKVNARLIELGVTPKVELQEYPVFTDGSHEEGRFYHISCEMQMGTCRKVRVYKSRLIIGRLVSQTAVY